VGGVSERPARDPERGNSFRRTRSRGGGKHLVCRKTAPFAGRRRNADLGRSESDGGLLLYRSCTDDNGCSSGAEKGNDVSSRKRKPSREHPTIRASKSPTPRGRVLCSVRRPVHVNRHYTAAVKADVGGAFQDSSRSGKPVKAGGTGTEGSGDGRSAAHRVSTSSQGEALDTSEKEEGRGPRPYEDARALVKCPHVVRVVVAEVGRRRRSQIRSRAALQKEWRHE